MNIGIDMMGGDYAPEEAVKGVGLYRSSDPGSLQLTLIGDKSRIENLLKENSIPESNISVVHAEEVIDMHESPTKALKEKPKSSIAIGFRLLASDKIDAFTSAGNTVRMLVGALFSIKT